MSEKRNVNVSLSSDELKAYISIAPSPAQTLVLRDLGPLLRKAGVVHGIKRDMLMLVLDRYNNGVDVKNVVIAEGVEPFEGVKPSVEYKFELSSEPTVDPSGRINYREISKILNIKKDQLLAIKKKAKQPIDGMTVTGKKTSFPEILDIPLRVGENVTKEDKGEYVHFRAGVSGALKFENNVLSVFPSLDIAGDVDFNTGNIRFKGDVKVGRDVLPDFVIDAEGKIFVWGSAIACLLKATDGIEVRGGIVGKNKGTVESGEDVIATFMENASLTARYDVIIKNGIIGSNLTCNGFLKVEAPRSRIIGSTIKASRGISARNIGSRFDTSTVIVTGIDPQKQEEVEKVKHFLEEKIKEANEIEKRQGRTALESGTVPAFASTEAREDVKKWHLLKKEIQTIMSRMKTLENDMYDHDAVVVAKETLFPRVIITIGKHKITTNKEHNNATVKYSEEEDRLVID